MEGEGFSKKDSDRGKEGEQAEGKRMDADRGGRMDVDKREDGCRQKEEEFRKRDGCRQRETASVPPHMPYTCPKIWM